MIQSLHDKAVEASIKALVDTAELMPADEIGTEIANAPETAKAAIAAYLSVIAEAEEVELQKLYKYARRALFTILNTIEDLNTRNPLTEKEFLVSRLQIAAENLKPSIEQAKEVLAVSGRAALVARVKELEALQQQALTDILAEIERRYTLVSRA